MLFPSVGGYTLKNTKEIFFPISVSVLAR